MPGFHQNRRPRTCARPPLQRHLRTCTLVEELEPRTLLAASPLASLLAPLSSPVSLLAPGLMRLLEPGSAVRGAAPSENLTSLLGHRAASIPTLVIPISPVAQAVSSAQPVRSVLPEVRPGNTELESSLPSQVFFPTTTAPANTTPASRSPLTNLVGPEALPGAAIAPTAANTFTALPTGPNPAPSGATPPAGQTATLSPLAPSILTFLSLPATVGVLIPQQFLPPAPAGPGQTFTTPSAAAEAPMVFNPAAYNLLFVVGGPEDQASEDYLDEYDDGAVLPAPDLPPISMIDRIPAVTRDARAVSRPAEAVVPVAPNWPLLSEAYFREEIQTTAGVPTEVIERTSLGLGAAETPPRVETEAAEARPELLAAIAGLGLLGAPSWRKEERDREESRRRPTVLPLGPQR